MEILEICRELTKEIPSEQIYMNEPMSKHTTFKVGGNADIFAKVKNIKELKHVIKIARKNDIHITVAGVPKKAGFKCLKYLKNFKDDLIFEYKYTNKNMIFLNHYYLLSSYLKPQEITINSA